MSFQTCPKSTIVMSVTWGSICKSRRLLQWSSLIWATILGFRSFGTNSTDTSISGSLITPKGGSILTEFCWKLKTSVWRENKTSSPICSTRMFLMPGTIWDTSISATRPISTKPETSISGPKKNCWKSTITNPTYSWLSLLRPKMSTTSLRPSWQKLANLMEGSNSYC